ncbi:MAG: hypothetical protein JNM18_02475, partial [Planctomycetaceae bacterium]|nr:hypothetical protein [Planctomycetaceae bacterium]
WRKIPGDTVLEVKMPDVASKSLYAIVMGQSGIELGLALYEDEKLLQQLLRGEFLSQKSARSIPATSVMFAEAFHLSARDVDAIERHGWNLAGPEAYPFAVCISGTAEFKLPTVAELRVLTLALLAIPSYLANRQSTLDVPLGDVTRRVMIRQLD